MFFFLSYNRDIHEELARSGPAKTLFGTLFLSQSKRYHIEFMTHYGDRLKNWRIKFWTKNLCRLRNYSFSREAGFLAIFSYIFDIMP